MAGSEDVPGIASAFRSGSIDTAFAPADNLLLFWRTTLLILREMTLFRLDYLLLPETNRRDRYSDSVVKGLAEALTLSDKQA